MLIGHIPLLLVFLKIPEYVRDILQLPLMGPRILYIDLYLLVLGCVLCHAENSRQLRHGIFEFRASRPVLRWLAVLCSFVALVFIITTAREEEPFIVLQLALFVLSIYGVQLCLQTRDPGRLLSSVNAVLVLIASLQSCYWLAGALGVPINADLLGRNQLPYVALSVCALAAHFRLRSLAWRALVVTLLLTLVNSTRGAFVLLAVLVLVYPLDRMLRRSFVLRPIVTSVLLAIGILSPIILFYSALSYLGIAVRQLMELESQRYFIVDNYSSLISRTISVILTLEATVDHGALLGLGQSRAADLLFFGYPVHNYLVSMIAILGIAGAALGATLVLLFGRLGRYDIGLALFGVYLLTAANDVYASMALLLMPMMSLRGRPTASPAQERVHGPLRLAGGRGAR